MSSSDRKWLWLALAAVLVVLGGIYIPEILGGMEKTRLGRLSTTQLEELVRKRPEDTEARYRLGLAYAGEDRHREAIDQFLQVQAKEPTRADVLNDLGVSYLLQERYYEALLALQGAVQAQPDLPVALANLGRLHLATKMPFTAARELERAAKLDPHNPYLLCDLGEAYQRTLNLNAALKTFQKVAREHPKNARALIGEGRAYFSLTRYDEAEQSLNKAMVLDPKESDPPLLLGRMALERAASREDLEKARGLLKQAQELDPQEPEVWYDLGRVAVRSSDPKTAIRNFAQALTYSPEHPGATYQLARALRSENREADAQRVERIFRGMSLRSREISRLEEVMVANPKDWASCLRLAQLYAKDGKAGMAALYLGRLEQAVPNDPALPALRQDVNALVAQRTNLPASRSTTLPSASGAGRPISGM